MAHLHHGDDVKSGYAKVNKILGHTDNFRHPTEKAQTMADLPYYENEKLDPLTLPARERVGPLPVGNPPGSALGRK